MAKSHLKSGSATKRVADALDCGYAYRQAEMLRWMVSRGLEQFGLQPTETIPAQALPAVDAALQEYAIAVQNNEPFSDTLGPIYMELAGRWGKSVLAQFFTPFPVASMMAAMSLGSDSAATSGLIKTCDPACGSGVMLLALANTLLRRYGPASLLKYSFTGADIDPICANMAALQFLANCTAHDVPVGEVLILCGNSLFPWDHMRQIVHATAPNAPPALPGLHPSRLLALETAAQMHLPGFEDAVA